MNDTETVNMPAWLKGYTGPAKLKERFLAGEMLMLLARNSATSLKANLDAINDLRGAVEGLKKQGIDIGYLIPSNEALLRMLANAKFNSSEETGGRKIPVKSIVIEPPGEQVCFVIIVGSGRKIDDDLIQPAIAISAAHVLRLKPALIFAKRFDRIGRHGWAMGPLMLAVGRCHAWVGDTIHGLMSQDLATDFSVFFSTRSGQMMADIMVPSTRDGMRRRTDAEMVKGRVMSGLGGGVPSGLVAVRLRDGAGMGKQLLALDGPKWLPPKSEVAFGLPEIYDANGEHVDQVANVCFALSKLRAPGWTPTRLLRTLVERQYSTSGIRSRRGTDTTVILTDDPANQASYVLKRIIKNLEFYKTGVLRRNMGIEGIEDVVITGCFPPQGFWALDEDFKRIEEWEENTTRKRDTYVKQTFSGFPITSGGHQGLLLRSPLTTPDRRSYHVVDAATYGKRSKRLPGHCVIPTIAIANLVKELIISAGDSAVQLIPFDADIDGRLLELRQNCRYAREQLDTYVTESVDIEARTVELDSDGEPALQGALLRKMSEKYTTLVEVTIPEITAKVEELSDQEQAYVNRLRKGRKAFQLDEVMQIVQTLADPEDRTYRHVFREALSDLEITTKRVTRGALRGREHCLSGVLTIGVGKDSIRLEGSYEWEDGSMTELDPRVDAVVEQLMDGVCFHDIGVAKKSSFRDLIAERTGIDRLHLDPILLVRDQRILSAVLAAVVTMPTSSPLVVAEKIDEPEAFVRRLRALYGPDAKPFYKWAILGSRVLAQMLWIASQGDGLIRFEEIIPEIAYTKGALSVAAGSQYAKPLFEPVYGVGFRLIGRCDCTDGAPRFMTIGLREPAGPVCIVCRRDRLGIEWPADRYDKYVIAPIKGGASA